MSNQLLTTSAHDRHVPRDFLAGLDPNAPRVSASTEKLLADFQHRMKPQQNVKVCKRTLDRWRRLGEGPPVTNNWASGSFIRAQACRHGYANASITNTVATVQVSDALKLSLPPQQPTGDPTGEVL